ncbi:hypothetical protein ACP2AV_04675 [Aliiroseovarius sp. PTFE2010]|uniref:hypothetical protein n=1 Tax=Aliiroseovarius sp. PTFE2010 TaxID=3417190 RepID=UPI003CF20F97
MTRIAAILTFIVSVSSSAVASPYVPLTEEHLEPGVVEIEVSAEDLARCRVTVEQVLTTSPVPPTAHLQPAATTPFTGPSVVCVLRDKG